MIAVIMAGGSGTRFWPRSTSGEPKQFLRLFGDKSLLQETVERIEPLVERERILVVTGATVTRLRTRYASLRESRSTGRRPAL